MEAIAGVATGAIPQGALVDHTIRVNAQALITISRKRLCRQASKETREVWAAVIEAVRAVEPELASVCVPDCVYRGHCNEMKPCGYAESTVYKLHSIAYTNGNAISLAHT